MMTEDQARDALVGLVKKYLPSGAKENKLIKIINDTSRPGLPVRGVLESMKGKTTEYSDSDKKLIEELIYLYG
ncbi:hypothetical protein HXX02_16945 [Microbulbifer elongatus]|uniref:Uncharacterized protein n=1 Tax=Microbulbifer elongatus TaxID=86173 RepID=A0ABT1P7N0_9GAMM|nr:hypothetical protein [Microbulbifer elongatus]MCQ3831124.1 hypothetical protein [Microbulbifer elongatus]